MTLKVERLSSSIILRHALVTSSKLLLSPLDTSEHQALVFLYGSDTTFDEDSTVQMGRNVFVHDQEDATQVVLDGILFHFELEGWQLVHVHVYAEENLDALIGLS